MVDWSWELLTGAERMVLRRLAVFSGGASLEAAERVALGADLGGDAVVRRGGGVQPDAAVALVLLGPSPRRDTHCRVAAGHGGG